MDRSKINAAGELLVIDGTAEDGTYQGDGMDAPFVIFNVPQQRNVAGPFDSMADAQAALAAA
ncbi:hypothetical protein DP49_961 [Burkholderia pseudomallei]|uniref:hypothetical protein n=1 Tax=Burkholderia pseudomallei TaxID=28450 RepID=UPI00050ECC14|nr:hypothetical protein [Burkholderia pseudomallei]KGD55414.1 hypothetical protein DP49_961 [Burkholderia pseudomallei]KGW25088.1 hypothetical protein Y047_4986 [Burkholderia pseudomallei MSHR3016]